MKSFLIVTACAFVFFGCESKTTTIQHGKLRLEFNSLMHSRVSSDGSPHGMMDRFVSSEYLTCRELAAKDFKIKDAYHVTVQDSIGTGVRWILRGTYVQEDFSVEKLLFITLYDRFPDIAFCKTHYINRSQREVHPQKWISNRYELLPSNDSIPFWSFQGESTGARKDWVLALKAGFRQKNYMGMNNTDYGGGIPVTDVWTRQNGIAIGHAEVVPELVALPVEFDAYTNRCTINIEKDLAEEALLPGDTVSTNETFVMVHSGDYYAALKRYGEVLRAKGLSFAKPEDEAFEASWCAWGYMRDVTLDEITGTLPKVKELGIEWVTIDDGYQRAEGDWHVNKRMFPGGDAEMKSLVQKLHDQGFKVMLWWAPLAADPGSELLRQDPEMKSVTEDGAPHYITWWDSYYLSPSYAKTKQHTIDMLHLFLEEWNVDGLKMDGQHLNAVHPDYDSQHQLKTPESSCEDLPLFFKMIYDEARAIKPHAVLQLCPCGTCMSVFNMPYMNQAVASDPLSSWQVRLKGKTYKAIMPEAAYFGDHVELSDGRADFASSFGIGAVPGTKFTWPKENPTVKEDNLLTPEKEIVWKNWFSLYQTKMLSKSVYRGELYDIGYDIPEAHVIQKEDTMHYAFYRKEWDGVIELRGLEASRYRVRDYVNKKELGTISKNEPRMKFSFKDNLLIEVYPVVEQ
jgi:alpha-galactosidase